MAEHQLSEQYREGLRAFAQVMPDVVGAYSQFTGVCFDSGEIDRKHKHLMALGISLYAGNEHCIVYHLEGALDEGATPREIAETAAVAGAYGGGTALSHGAILINEVLEKRNLRLQ